LTEAKRSHIKALFPRINDIKDSEIREKVVSVWLSAWEKSSFARIEDISQWEPTKEELEISNVAHTNQVVECAMAIANVVEREQGIRIDNDALIAAAILHDVDKMLMFDPSVKKEKAQESTIGNYLPHTAIGTHLLLEAELPIEIVHIVASHSTKHSSIPPKTTEAVILYHADLVLSRTWKIFKKIDVS
jgi:putative nucleotidyltransferase with HDIG domain